MINKRKEKWSEDKKIQFKKNYIKGKNNLIDVKKLSIEEIHELFHKLKVESVNNSQEKRIKTIKNKGNDEWSKITKLGQYNRKIRFLIKNNIINDNYNRKILEIKPTSKINENLIKIKNAKKKCIMIIL